MKKAYLVDISTMIRVIAKDSDQAAKLAIELFKKDPIYRDGSGNVEVTEDFDSPFNKEYDTENS